MKEKIKKFFSKDNLFILICTLLIGLFVVMTVLYLDKDIKNKDNNNNKSNINLVNDENNLNTSFLINEDGNLVGSNLLDPSTISSGMYLATGTGLLWNAGNGWYTSDYILIPRGNDLYIKNFNALCLYDSNKSFIEGSGLNFDDYTSTHDYHLISSNNVRYIKITALDIVQTMVSYEDIPYEPFGIWYSQTNYDNLQTQYDIVLSNINPLSVNNISSNSLILNSIDVSSELQGSIFLSNLNGGLGFYNYDFDSYSSFNTSGVNDFNLVSNFNNIYSIFGCSAFVSLSHSAEDYLDISFYRDNQLILSINDLDSETTQEYMQTYSNMEIQFNKLIISGKYTSGSSSRSGVNYIIDNNTYAFGYQQGYKDSEIFYDGENTRLVAENSQLTNDLNNLNNNYNSLNTNYQNLLTQYNNLANNEYTFSELFWSISSVPFGVLASGFNVNVLGVNLAAIITGLFTALLIIWLIKKFLK